MKSKENFCCEQIEEKKREGIFAGILWGIFPHSFCIAFILFSIIGATTATIFFEKLLLIKNLFYFLVLVSLVFATISIVIYLKKCECLCVSGVKRKWKYISTMYFTTILINLSLFFIIFPVLANMNGKTENSEIENISKLSINVEIPCSGHAPLVIEEIKKSGGIQSVKYNLPDNFEIRYDAQKNSLEKIIALEIFKTFKVRVNS